MNHFRYSFILTTLLYLFNIANAAPLLWHDTSKGDIYTSTSRELFFKDVNISIDETPLLNQPVTIMFTVNPLLDLQNSKIKIFLPDGIERIDGILEWNGNLRKEEEIQLNTSVKVVKDGEWEVRVYVEGALPDGGKDSRSYYVYFKTFGKNGSVSSFPLTSQPQQQLPKKIT